jgi:hypothetical protein
MKRPDADPTRSLKGRQLQYGIVLRHLLQTAKAAKATA